MQLRATSSDERRKRREIALATPVVSEVKLMDSSDWAPAEVEPRKVDPIDELKRLIGDRPEPEPPPPLFKAQTFPRRRGGR
jgi:hypothetical protein